MGAIKKEDGQNEIKSLLRALKSISANFDCGGPFFSPTIFHIEYQRLSGKLQQPCPPTKRTVRHQATTRFEMRGSRRRRWSRNANVARSEPGRKRRSRPGRAIRSSQRLLSPGLARPRLRRHRRRNTSLESRASGTGLSLCVLQLHAHNEPREWNMRTRLRTMGWVTAMHKRNNWHNIGNVWLAPLYSVKTFERIGHPQWIPDLKKMTGSSPLRRLLMRQLMRRPRGAARGGAGPS